MQWALLKYRLEALLWWGKENSSMTNIIWISSECMANNSGCFSVLLDLKKHDFKTIMQELLNAYTLLYMSWYEKLAYINVINHCGEGICMKNNKLMLA